MKHELQKPINKCDEYHNRLAAQADDLANINMLIHLYTDELANFAKLIQSDDAVDATDFRAVLYQMKYGTIADMFDDCPCNENERLTQ